MGIPLPRIKPKSVVRALQRAGFVVSHQRGSHVQLKHSVKHGFLVTVPCHHKDLPLRTLHSILKQTGLSVEEFKELL